MLERKKQLVSVLTVAGFILLWQWRASGMAFIPTPVDVGSAFFSLIQNSSVQTDIASTAYRVYISSVIALFLGLVIGIAEYFSETVSRAMDTFFYPTQFVSEAVLTLVAIVLFGLSPIVVYIITVIAILPDIFVTVREGLKDIEEELMEFGEVHGSSKYRIARHIILPQILPYLTSGFIRAHAVSWDIVATTEIFLATSGLGYLVQNYYRLLDLPNLFATVLIILIAGLTSDFIIRKAKSRIDKYYMGPDKSN